MERYFDEQESIYGKLQNRTNQILEVIADHYRGSHPAHPVKYRAFSKDGFLRTADYRYHFDLAKKFPYARNGQFAYTWSKLWSQQPAELILSVSCFGPVRVFKNGEEIYKSSIIEEIDPAAKTNISVTVNKGWNFFLLLFEKTPSGFGGMFGTGSFKNFPLHFLIPSEERKGQEGWLYSNLLDQPLKEFEKEWKTEAETNLTWFPKQDWENDKNTGTLSRLFSLEENDFALAWTKIRCRSSSNKLHELVFQTSSKIEIFVSGSKVDCISRGQTHTVQLDLGFGEYDLVVKVNGFGQGDFSVETADSLQLILPVQVEGAGAETWLFAGSFHQGDQININEAASAIALFETKSGTEGWRLDLPNLYIRPYLENALYGKWNYPLGVTLYGLLEAGKELQRQDLSQYVRNHIESTTEINRYALWDKKQYGAAAVNNQLSAIDSLDDCGSFGATMLLASKMGELKGAEEIADEIAYYISAKQDRLEDGTLYRNKSSIQLMKQTIWCDDLYMSTPFLCRYYEKTRDRQYLQDAAKQFLLYKNKLYMPELKIMSHVFDLKFQEANQVPWGRGNGWVLFSLSELLPLLQEGDRYREQLLDFFCELCEGYTNYQDQEGMWHQVLTDHTSYQEASCSSMFIYALARGIRFGWLKDIEKYSSAVFKGWEGLTKNAIDQFGNVYGVCKGSGYSFSANYYKHDLPWVLNDTHGIGIVLLAGVEISRLEQAFKEKSKLRSSLEQQKS